MTTIASTSYSTAASYFSAKDKAGSANADGEFTGQSAQNTGADRRDLAISDGSTSATDSRPSKVIVIVDGKVLTGNVIDVDVSKLEVDTTKLSDAEYKSLIEGRRQSIEADKQYLERQYTKYADPDISNEPKLKLCHNHGWRKNRRDDRQPRRCDHLRWDIRRPSGSIARQHQRYKWPGPGVGQS